MSALIQGMISPYRRLQTGASILKNLGLGKEQAALAKNYAAGRLFPEHSDDVHLDAVMKWLCLAQDVCSGEGVSNVYYLQNGWGVAYPETSGYIIATFLAYADFRGDRSYFDRAIQLGDWEIKIQAQSGGVFSSTGVSYTRVFNTGQVILGWCALYERTQDDRYLQAARRAGEYLVRLQEADGSWRKDTYCGARTYHSRVAWALLRLARLTGDPRFRDAARKNLQWVLMQQQVNGWFKQCGFNRDNPITHVIEYTLKGLLECHLMHEESLASLPLLPAVLNAADALCNAIKEQPVRGVSGMVPTSFDEHWHSNDRHSCLTGNAQLAGFFFLLARVASRERYRTTAESILHATKKTQVIETSFAVIRGAVAGTYPLYQGYVSNGYPNWAAKFLADALIIKNFDSLSSSIPA